MSQPFIPPPPPPPMQGPTGWVDLTIQGSTLLNWGIAPRATLNGYLMPTHYGRNVYPVPPGPYRIELVAQWTKTYGQALLDVQVQEGQTVPVFYCQPTNVFSKGAIGHTKQKKPGMWFYWVLAAIVLVPFALALQPAYDSVAAPIAA
ncbi:MAG TPA: hypothetical protein VN088_20845 [Nocardioides sp.]|nr:hypothetical protein [Nocardioides sp.]